MTANRSLSILAMVVALSLGCQRTPQLGSEEGLGAADALWTAVTAKDPSLVADCSKKLEKLHAESKLTDDAYKVLEDVVSTANAGDWDGARADLKSFVRGQRPTVRH